MRLPLLHILLSLYYCCYHLSLNQRGGSSIFFHFREWHSLYINAFFCVLLKAFVSWWILLMFRISYYLCLLLLPVFFLHTRSLNFFSFSCFMEIFWFFLRIFEEWDSLSFFFSAPQHSSPIPMIQDQQNQPYLCFTFSTPHHHITNSRYPIETTRTSTYVLIFYFSQNFTSLFNKPTKIHCIDVVVIYL